jgi:hypothetical protein
MVTWSTRGARRKELSSADRMVDEIVDNSSPVRGLRAAIVTGRLPPNQRLVKAATCSP